MRFGSKEIPNDLFELAQDRMLMEAAFTPEDVRQFLLTKAAAGLAEVSLLPVNQRIIANRVVRAVIRKLVSAGEIAQLKRGVWAKKSFLDAASSGQK